MQKEGSENMSNNVDDQNIIGNQTDIEIQKKLTNFLITCLGLLELCPPSTTLINFSPA